METLSLFSHFAQRTGAPERHATDALCFILQRSIVAQGGIARVSRQQGVNLPEKLDYESQVLCGDGCIPTSSRLMSKVAGC